LSGKEEDAVSTVDADPAVSALYEDFRQAGLLPLWTQREDLMPLAPKPAAVPHVWPWHDVYPLARSEAAGPVEPEVG
jgi:gentisate 1,2-dioxygenase